MQLIFAFIRKIKPLNYSSIFNLKNYIINQSKQLQRHRKNSIKHIKILIEVKKFI